MLIELFPEPFIIEGDIPSRANIGMNWKLKNVPAEKIKNKNLRMAKQRLDNVYASKDYLVLMLKSYKSRNQIPDLPENSLIWICMNVYFKYKKAAKGATETDLKKDLDNAEKWIFDSFTASGIIPDDKNIVMKLVGKQVSSTKPRIEIVSLVATNSWANLPKWMASAADRTTHRIFSHQLEGNL